MDCLPLHGLLTNCILRVGFQGNCIHFIGHFCLTSVHEQSLVFLLVCVLLWLVLLGLIRFYFLFVKETSASTFIWLLLFLLFCYFICIYTTHCRTFVGIFDYGSFAVSVCLNILTSYSVKSIAVTSSFNNITE